MSGNNISNFIHLRTQSNYSLGKSVVRIKELVDIALKHKMPALCIADHGNLFGSLEFAMAALIRSNCS